MKKASNATAPVTSPSEAEPFPSSPASPAAAPPSAVPAGVSEHAPPTVLVTVGRASSAFGLAAAAEAAVSHDTAGSASDRPETGETEPALPYSADEAAWLFG